jgi:hypothetical protein
METRVAKRQPKSPAWRNPPPKPEAPKIKACRFCGLANAQCVENGIFPTGQTDANLHLVVCACGARGPVANTPEAAIAKWDAAWNKRPRT